MRRGAGPCFRPRAHAQGCLLAEKWTNLPGNSSFCPTFAALPGLPYNEENQKRGRRESHASGSGRMGSSLAGVDRSGPGRRTGHGSAAGTADCGRGVAAGFQGHPRLLGPKRRLRATAQARPEEYKIVKSNASILAVGITQAIEGVPRSRIEPLLAAAMKNVRLGPTNLHQDTWIRLNEVALAYDFFHDEIPPAERRAMVDWLNAHLEKYTADENAFHNSTLSKILVYLRIAYATWRRKPAGQGVPRLRDQEALRRPGRARCSRSSARAADSPSAAGIAADRCGTWSRAWNWRGGSRVTTASRRPRGSSTSAWPTRCSSPIRAWGSTATSSTRRGRRVEHLRRAPRVPAPPADAAWPSTSAARNWPAMWPRKQRKGSNPEARADRLPLRGAGRPAARPEHASPWRTVPAASARSTPAATGRTTPPGCASSAATSGTTTSTSRRATSRSSATSRWPPKAASTSTTAPATRSTGCIRTIAHNCILVYQPGETWQQLRDGGRNPYANDGGQTNHWGWPVATLEEWNGSGEQFERGKLLAYDNQPEYLFVAGDCTKAYAADEALPLDAPDRLSPAGDARDLRPRGEHRAGIREDLAVALKNEPQIEADRVTVTSGKGRLVSQTLLPEKPTIRKVFGYTYRGQTFDEKESSLTPAAAKWRVEVLPSRAAKEDLFLHVLFTDQPQPARLVRHDNAVGVRIGQAEVLFTGQLGGRLTLSGRQHAMKAGLNLGKYE